MGDKQLDFLDAFIFADPNQKAKLCKTIELFTKMFPDLNRYVSKRNNQTIFELEKSLDVPKNLATFFNVVKAHLKKKNER